MFLVTGTGCSGTGWMSQFFTKLGFECGHEQWYKVPYSEIMQSSESSWLAIPFLSVIPNGTKIIRVVRHPLDVIKSAYATGFLNDSTSQYANFIKRYRKDINLNTDNHLERVINWVVRWDWPLMQWHAPHCHRVENTDPNHLFTLIRYATGQNLDASYLAEIAKSIPTNVNTHRKNIDVDFITWEFIRKHHNSSGLITRALELGYSVYDE